MIRRAVAAGLGLLVIVLLVVGIKGCLNGQQEQSLKDFNRDVANVVQAADQNTATLFDTLSAGGSSANDLQTQINQLRVRAETQTRTAAGLSAPDEMKVAQHNLVLTLSLIQEAIGKIAEKLPSALGSDATVATAGVRSIAGEMQSFTAADVVYQRRVAALIAQVLADQQIGGQVIQTSSFQQNLDWLNPDIVAQRIGSKSGRGAGGGAIGPVAPGTHGHQLVSVSVAGKTLVAGTVGNRVAGGANVVLKVTIANQGVNNETDVRVKVKISGSGVKTINTQQTISQTRAGMSAEVDVPIGQSPPAQDAVVIRVEVVPVRSEGTTTNNTLSYAALFE